MTKSVIQAQLTQNYAAFCAFYKTMNEADFRYTPPEKWDIGQHLDHDFFINLYLCIFYRIRTSNCGYGIIIPCCLKACQTINRISLFVLSIRNMFSL